MRRYYHQLTFGLSFVQLAHKPGITCFVQITMSPVRAKASVGWVIVALRIIKHNDLYRQFRVRLESVTGKTVFYISFIKTMSLRIGGGIEKF